MTVPLRPAALSLSAATVPSQPAAVRSASPPPTAASSGVRTWVRRLWRGGQVTESCPSWCASAHANDENGALDDLVHVSSEAVMHLPVWDAEHGTLAMPVLSARISVHPYSETSTWRIPHVTLEPWQDEVMECLDPAEFAAVIAQVRAHCDRLDGVLARLVAARAECGGS